jgi:hypothetical protein
MSRHDYKGVRMDIEMWWPKLVSFHDMLSILDMSIRFPFRQREGGIMAGHDYLTQFDLSGASEPSALLVTVLSFTTASAPPLSSSQATPSRSAAGTTR